MVQGRAAKHLMGRKFKKFEPAKYSQKLLKAGQVFRIKYHVGQENYIHVQIYQPNPDHKI